jgi:hypothetical protein
MMQKGSKQTLPAWMYECQKGTGETSEWVTDNECTAQGDK